MAFVALTTKIPNQQIRVLKALSERTRISQSELIREGIQFVIQKYKEDIVTPQIRREIDLLLREDKKLLERLS